VLRRKVLDANDADVVGDGFAVTTTKPSKRRGTISACISESCEKEETRRRGIGAKGGSYKKYARMAASASAARTEVSRSKTASRRAGVIWPLCLAVEMRIGMILNEQKAGSNAESVSASAQLGNGQRDERRRMRGRADE
jgi:hypothetical protein